MNRFISSLSLCLATFGIQAQVVLNEISAANYSHTMDNYGEYDDWIELYNTSATAVDLGGYYLSDRVNNNTKWQIPEGCIIEPFGYQLFWCTRRNTDEGGAYHTNFKITQSTNEPVVFSDPSGNILEIFTLDKNNQTNHSRGRVSDGAATWGVFMEPTPGAANITQVYQEYPSFPVFSHGPGFYSGSLSLAISSNEAGSIHYTLDGSEPTQNSPVYTGPITLSETTVVRAVVHNPDPLVPAGFIETNTYFLNENFTVPVISASGDDIITLLNGTQLEPVGHFEIFDEEGTFRDEGLGEYNKHGNDSWAYDQRGLDWITRDEFGYNNEIDYRIFRDSPRRYFQRFILKAGANCNYPFQDGGAHVRDFYVQSLSQVADLELDERSAEFCVLFANGQYWGLYDIREKVDDPDFTDYYYDQKKEDIDFLKTWGATWEEYGSIDDWNTLRDFILNNDMADADNYAYVKTQYSTLSLIDYFVMNSYVVAADWLNWNTGWWRGRNPDGGAQQWRYILWDMDAVFGHYINYTGIPNTGSSADICFPEALNDPGGQGHVPIWNKLLENEDFQAEYVNRMSDLSNSFFSCEFMTAHLDSLVAIMEPEMPAHIARWGGTIDGWNTNMQSIYDFIAVRCEELNNNILDCYEWLDGPYELRVEVQPPGAGKVKVNTITPPSYPFVGQYFGGISQSLEAFANPAFEFSHWSVGELVITPDSLSAAIGFMLDTNATVVAHFEPKFLFDITFEVHPELSGAIAIGDEIQEDFPYTTEMAAAVQHSLEAQAKPGFLFDRWELTLPNQITPGLGEPMVNLEVAFEGTVKAFFVENNNAILFDVSPPGKGFIEIDGERIESYPEIRNLPANFSYTLDAKTDEEFYRFSHWTALHHSFLPDSSYSGVNMEFDQGDVITAHFVEIPNYTLTFLTNPKDKGEIQFGDLRITEFPHTQTFRGQTGYALEAVVPFKWEFEEWDFIMRPELAGSNFPALRYTPIRNDTIVLNLNERFSDVFIPSAFSPNGDGVNELIRVQGPEISEVDFKWVIYSRWGDLVFESNDIEKAWNGAKLDSDYYCPVGIYTYHLTFRNAITNENERRDGSIMLIR